MDSLTRHVFAWHALSDACPICQALNGREWREQNVFQNTLWDMFYGDIWNFDADHTLAHPNCRCQLEVRFEPVTPNMVKVLLQDAKTLLVQLQEMREALRSNLE